MHASIIHHSALSCILPCPAESGLIPSSNPFREKKSENARLYFTDTGLSAEGCKFATMKVHTTNYQDIFIRLAEDCPAAAGEIPPERKKGETAAMIQFEMISKHPYRYTSDDVLFQVYAEKNDLTEEELPAAREQFFSKGQPCFRASPLPKRYGWGVHSNQDEKVALYGCETPEYQQLSAGRDPVSGRKVNVYRAMRSSR
ncbi:MAG TPA: DUF6157 family protein [Anseongella sp.]